MSGNAREGGKDKQSRNKEMKLEISQAGWSVSGKAFRISFSVDKIRNYKPNIIINEKEQKKKKK